jgi:hypothetical protein
MEVLAHQVVQVPAELQEQTEVLVLQVAQEHQGLAVQMVLQEHQEQVVLRV